MLTFEEYREQDGLGLAALIKSGDTSRAEVVIVAHAAFTAAHEKLNCAVEISPLSDCEKRAADAPDALFGGVPFAFKDLGAHPAYGLQESGSRFCKGLPVGHASHLATCFEASGLVNLGRTTVPEFGYNTATETIAYGQTKNPWNVAHTPGGSSGGSSAAVAYGALPVAHANDGGGSIRIPAAYCGLVGLKPGRGRVSTAPDFAEGLNGIGIEHIVSRSVRDTAAMLDFTSQPAVGGP
jgi:amidase